VLALHYAARLVDATGDLVELCFFPKNIHQLFLVDATGDLAEPCQRADTHKHTHTCTLTRTHTQIRSTSATCRRHANGTS
jgi:hypothetical protein